MPVLLAGAGEVGHRLASILETDPYTGFRIVGYCNGVREARADLNVGDIPCLGSLKDIVPEAKRRDVKILLACQDERLFRCQMEDFSAWFTYVEFLPTANAFPVIGARAVTFDGLGGLEMVNQARKRVLRVQKRILDWMLAVLAFFLALPFFVIIPILVKLTSRGPVFYRQRRLGRGGKPFFVWKFRSMYVDADARLQKLLAENPEVADEWERKFKLADDPRVTPFGRFLRRTSLDEIPQLINVLCGEMALIGPRPIVDEEVKYYGSSYETFASVRPGITGLWQVSGRSETDYDRRVALDTYYVINWSPWLDIWILLRTALVVALMRGAR
jgi:Undecaprenyl-phosphate galactose phosphotransferase WbaP